MALTEVRASPGADDIRGALEDRGFQVFAEPSPPQEYHTIVATKGFRATKIEFPTFPLSHRVTAISIQSFSGPVTFVGVYAPTNGMNQESSERRREFQRRFTDSLGELLRGRGSKCIVAGDLNVLEPGHQPRIDVYEEHDFEFYRSFQNLQLGDAYRTTNPHKIEHSWIDRSGIGQRLDHVFISVSLIPTLNNCWYDHTTRYKELSDHSAMLASLSCAKVGATSS
jgi:exonuclease III